LQLAFTQTQEKQNQIKIAKHKLAEILEGMAGYKESVEKENALRAFRKQLLKQAMDSFPDLAREIEKIIADLKIDKERISYLAIKQLIEGNSLESIEDTHGNKYEPVYSVKFKKI
jgi:predicted component of type VI protein secretion system